MSLIVQPGSLVGLGRAVAAQVKANISQIMIQILSDEQYHAEALGAGPFKWRTAFTRQMGSFYDGNRSHCDDLADSMYRWMRESWRDRHPPGVSPESWLDAFAPVSPPTEAEIEGAWELEIASSEGAMRLMYEGSARTRKGSWLGSKDPTRRP